MSVTPLDAARCGSLLHYCELLASVNTTCFRKYSHRCINNFPGYNIWTSFKHVIRQFRESFSGFLLPDFPEAAYLYLLMSQKLELLHDTSWVISEKNFKNCTVSKCTVSQSVIFREERRSFSYFQMKHSRPKFLIPIQHNSGSKEKYAEWYIVFFNVCRRNKSGAWTICLKYSTREGVTLVRVRWYLLRTLLISVKVRGGTEWHLFLASSYVSVFRWIAGLAFEG